MTPTQWNALETQLEGAYGCAALRVDAYDITLSVERLKPRRYAIVVFVNGVWKTEMLRTDCEERRRFFRPVVECVIGHKAMSAFRKAQGKRAADAFKRRTTGTYWLPSWESFGAMKRHFLRNNKSLTLVSLANGFVEVPA